jgi:hypothetical protein
VLARTGERVVAGESVLAVTGTDHEIESRDRVARHSGENRALVAEKHRQHQGGKEEPIPERRARADRS